MVDNEKIKSRIKEVIINSGYTQIELAKRLHVTQSAIAHYIKGDIMPSLDTLANLCVILDVSPSYILCFEN